MSRRTSAPTRVILPDPKFGSEMLAKFMNMVMKSGKKSAAEHIMYGAIDRITEKTSRQGDAALEVLSLALENVKPAVEVKSRRVGGATYQVPVEVRPARRQTLAMTAAGPGAGDLRRPGPRSTPTTIREPLLGAQPAPGNVRHRSRWSRRYRETPL
jgi:small subunit ribosomal protein S7